MMTPLRFYSPQAAQLLVMAQQLRRFEGLPPTEQAALQQVQLFTLLRHALQYSPFWRARLQQAGFAAAAPTMAAFLRLPILTRADIQQSFAGLRARWPGLQDKDVLVATSSGSTGTPVRIEKDVRVYGPLYSALTWIEGQWHQRDPRRKIAVLNLSGQESDGASWGGAFATMGLHGPSAVRVLGNADLATHLEWLVAYGPDYLKCSPVVAAELAILALEQGVRLPLRQIVSQWERIAPRHRELCLKAFGAPIIDRYSCEEAGWLALECPTHHNLHVLNASVLLEIVDAAGQPCPPGVVGRVLITSLHGMAMPLIRYELGDLAQWGEPCGCGMSLPVLGRLWGRTRHQARLPGGRRIAVSFFGDEFGAIAAIREFRLIQYQGGELEVRIRAAGALSAADHQYIRSVIAGAGLQELPLCITEVASLDWEPGRKREEFEYHDLPFPAARAS